MSPRRLELDYVAPVRRPVWPGLLLLALSLGVAADLAVQYRDAQFALVRMAETASLLGPQGPAPRALPKERLDEEMRNAEAVMRQLTVPWASLVQAIEQAATREVAVLQLQPDAQNRIVRLAAEARNPEAMFEYLRRLASTKGLADVHLLSHQIQREDPLHPVQFSVQASVRGMP